MAGKKLSLAIAINLLTENFKKGKNNVVNGFKSMQVKVMTFVAALGFGSIGLSNFVSKLISVAKETNRVTTALKNVSGGLANYVSNQKFVNELANKYGLEVNALTGNFAKFTASATSGGMALEKQKKIFESVSRASTAFALSAEDTNSVFLALSQMMGKGKVASQELRLQMGEKLPVAVQAMANALGVSIAEMEKMMSKGELIANDVLPKFADALDNLTPSVDLDNLNTSLNRLENTFGELTNNLGVESKFKKIIDGVNSVLQSAANNLKTIFQSLVLGLVFFSIKGATSVTQRFRATLLERATSAEALAQKLKATELRATIELNKLEDLRTQHRFASAQRRLKLAEQVAAQESKYAKIQTDIARQEKAVESANTQKKSGVISSLRANYLERVSNAEALAKKLKEIELKTTIELNKLEDLRTQYNLASGKRRLKLAEQVAAQESKYANAQIDLSRQKVALETANAQKKLGVLGGVFSKIGASLKAMWSAFAPAVIITTLLSVYTYFKNIYDESKRIKNIFSDYQKEVSKISTSEEIVKLQSLYNISKNLKRSVDDRKNALSELAKQLNLIQGKNETDLDFQNRINAKIKERAVLLEATARVDKYTQQKIEAEDAFRGGKKKLGFEGLSDELLQPMLNDMLKYNMTGSDRDLQKAVDNYNNLKDKNNIKHTNGFQGIVQGMADYQRIMNDASANIEAQLSKTIIPEKTPVNNSTSTDGKETELSKLEENYAKRLAELDVKLQYSMMSQDEYNKAKDELIRTSFVDAKTSKDKAILESKYLKKLEQDLSNNLYDSQQAEFKKIQQSAHDGQQALSKQKELNVISEKEYNEKLKSLIDKTVEQLASMSNLTESQIQYIQTLQGQSDNLKSITSGSYVKEERDKTFDYKKSQTDILSDELDVAKKNYAQLKELASENLQEFESELNAMLSNVSSLEDALKLSRIKSDIKELNKEVTRGTLATADSIMSGVDGVVSSIQRISDAFDSTDASGWERIMAIWEGLMSTVDSFLQIIDLIERLNQVTQMLTTAKETEAAVDTATTTAKIANMTAETAAVNATVAEQTAVETAASTIKKTAATGEMAAKSTAAYASIPFAGPALAAAQIAAFTAMIAAASIPKFKNGGIIGGGATSGDQVLARVNAGEMILNQPQQSRLWKMLNSTSSVRSDGLEIGGKVRGSDIYLALSNYMKRTGKRI